MRTPRVLVLLDESNIVNRCAHSVEARLPKAPRPPFEARSGHALIQMTVYAVYLLQYRSRKPNEEKKNNACIGFVLTGSRGGRSWLTGGRQALPRKRRRLNGDRSGRASVEMHPRVVVLVTGDAHFPHLAFQLRRHGIGVEVAATPQTLRHPVEGRGDEVIDSCPCLKPLSQ